MKVHILGICGTFMGGIAALARTAGHAVSGSDKDVFPPMSTQLADLGIELHEGFDATPLKASPPDCVVVGNVMSRGMPVVEYLLDSGIPYTSGPQWLARHVLAGREVLAVAGTHGKTSTASLLAWILDDAGFDPGFLIGGVPIDFGISARVGGGSHFVVEADEYDTAFFDKRSKFVHYRPTVALLNNLEFDHADIFPDLDAIATQFHHLVRTVPRRGRIVTHAGDAALEQVLERGCWTPVERFGGDDSDWRAAVEDGEVTVRGAGEVARGPWHWPGRHNMDNALAACAVAHHAGVPLQQAVATLGRWQGVRRRLERVGSAGGIDIYDDFAHHPTEVAVSIAALRGASPGGRVIAVFEPRSNSMRMGAHTSALGPALASADVVIIYRPPGLRWDPGGLSPQVRVFEDLDALLVSLTPQLCAGDRVLIMSNGAFGGLPHRLLSSIGD